MFKRQLSLIKAAIDGSQQGKMIITGDFNLDERKKYLNYEWLNNSMESYKIKCKERFLS